MGSSSYSYIFLDEVWDVLFDLIPWTNCGSIVRVGNTNYWVNTLIETQSTVE